MISLAKYFLVSHSDFKFWKTFKSHQTQNYDFSIDITYMSIIIQSTVSAQIEGRPSINFSRFKTAALFEFGQSAGLIKLPLY